MNKKLIVFSILLAIVVIGTAGYVGVSSGAQPTPAPAPDTVAVTTCDVEQSVSAPGVVVNVKQETVTMPMDGRLSEISVQVGDQVRAGQSLARLDATTQYEAQVAIKDAQDALDEAETYQTSLVLAHGSAALIAEYEAKVVRAEKNVREAENEYKAVAGLPNGNPARDRALSALNKAREKLGELQSKLTWYKGNATEEDIAIADAQVALAQSDLDMARAVAASGEILAPLDGIVLSVEVDAHEAVQKDAPLIVIADPKALEVQANVTEEDYPLMEVGQSVDLFFDARPDVTVQGRIERIIPKRIEGDRPLYNIYISIDEVPDGLADGMTADTAVTIASRKGVLCLPRAVVRASGGDTTTVKVWDGAQETAREIKIGLRGDTNIEILSGLTEGEQVVMR